MEEKKRRRRSVPIGEAEISHKVTVNREVIRESGELQNLQTDEEPIEGLDGSVGLGLGMTVNLGNMEFARVDVRVTLPCGTDDKSIRATKVRCEDYVREFLAEEFRAATGKSLPKK